MKLFDEIKSVALREAVRAPWRRVTLVVLIVAVASAGVVFARHYYIKRARPAAAKAQGPIIDLIEIRNQTLALEVVSKKIENNVLQVEFRNVGERPIISYRIDLRESDKFVMDLSIGSPIAPSRTVHFGIPLPKLALDEQSRTYPLTISMALFTDGTGEGDRAKIDAQRDQFLGQAQAMNEMSKLISKLQSESELTSEQFAQQLNSLKSRVPANFNRDQTAGYMRAIQSLLARALILAKLPDNDKRKAGGIDSFKSAFARQLSNLKMIKQEAKP
jgi:hypothetical protein